MSPLFCLVLASLLTCLGQLCQKQAAHGPGEPGRQVRHLVLWLGLALMLMGMGMLLWLLVLQHIPVGIAYPMLSLNFVWIALAARFVWHERIGRRHWAGLALIMGGIALLGSSI